MKKIIRLTENDFIKVIKSIVENVDNLSPSSQKMNMIKELQKNGYKKESDNKWGKLFSNDIKSVIELVKLFNKDANIDSWNYYLTIIKKSILQVWEDKPNVFYNKEFNVRLIGKLEPYLSKQQNSKINEDDIETLLKSNGYEKKGYLWTKKVFGDDESYSITPVKKIFAKIINKKDLNSKIIWGVEYELIEMERMLIDYLDGGYSGILKITETESNNYFTTKFPSYVKKIK